MVRKTLESSVLIGVPKNIVTSQAYCHISEMDIDDYYDSVVSSYFSELFNLY